MRIVVLCEGQSEAALRRGLREFVQDRAETEARVGVDTRSLKGPVMRQKLSTLVANHSADHDVAGIIALADVYPNYSNANEAKEALWRWAGDAGKSGKFRAHAAQFDLEAWLMPFWDKIASDLGLRAASPGAKPEQINSQNPPSKRLKELYRKAKKDYEKPVDAAKYLTADRLKLAATDCPELKLFLNSLLEFAGADRLP